MTDGDLLGEAVAELYSSDPDEFVERRGALVARAREAGQAPAAKQIAALRKPTRSAWVVNRLVRADPGVAAELAGLGEELRAAQDSLDGSAIRELSQQRRELIESLVRRAFTVVGVSAPPAAIRDEVTATLSAALADQHQADAGHLVEDVGQVRDAALVLDHDRDEDLAVRVERPDVGARVVLGVRQAPVAHRRVRAVAEKLHLQALAQQLARDGIRALRLRPGARADGAIQALATKQQSHTVIQCPAAGQCALAHGGKPNRQPLRLAVGVDAE